MTIIKHNDYQQIATVVANGGIIIYPTDTIWGLGCNALDTTATQKLRQIKGKPADAPLVWLLPSLKAITKYCGAVTPLEKKLLHQPRTSVIINGQAVRLITHGWLNKLLTRCGVPLVATSANRHGESVITSWRQGINLLATPVDAIVKGRKIYQNIPSTLAQITDGQIKIIRQGSGISIK